MAEAKKLITREYRLNSAKQLIESVSEPANTVYYTFFGNHLDYPNTAVIPQPNDSISETVIDAYRNMIYGKRVSPNDLILVIPRNDYVSNKVYDMYDDTVGEANISLYSTNYYTIVNADANYHVFKCLDNNQGSNSTVQPEFSEIDANDEIYETSDGYVWKYMYSVDNATVRKFATSDFFPIVPNTQVIEAAKNGKIDVIKVVNAGRGYDNYCNGVFSVDDLRVNGNSRIYSINSSLTANVNPNYYKGCYVYITAGTGVGQYKKITNYTVNSTVKAIILESQFSVAPQSDSFFDISPGVDIIGDGTQTINATARAIVNSVGNTIQKIEILETGENYNYATATILVDSVVGVSSNATIRPIYSPPGGHGSDPAAELGATRVCVSTRFANTDVEIPVSNDYRTIGLLRDPTFANVVLNISNTVGNFIASERIFKATKSIRIASDASINTTSSIVTANADFVNQLNTGDYIYLGDGANYQLTTVNSISNSSFITISTNGYFSCSSALIFKAPIGSQISQVDLQSSQLTGNLVTNTSSVSVYGKGTNFFTELTPNVSSIFIYGNSSFGGDLRKVVSVQTESLSFNPNTNINDAEDFITIVENVLTNNDVILYYTSAGNTAVTGLSNNTYYYVVSANSTGIKLSDSRGGSAKTISASSVSENGHFVSLQKVVVESNLTFTNTDSKAIIVSPIITANVISNIENSHAYVTSVATGTLQVTNVAGIFTTDDFIIGERSGAIGYVTTVERNGVVKGFETFSQMYKYIGTPISPNFSEDETVYQSETTNISDQFANAYLHSITGTGPTTNYYVTNQIGLFNESINMIGSNTGASALITGKYSPELVFGSGKIIFEEKIEPIIRTSSSSETIKFILEF